MIADLPATAAEARSVGSLHYMTGKPCKRGHVTKRFASSLGCIECAATRVAENPEARSATIARYYARHCDVILVKNAAYRAANPEVRKATQLKSAIKCVVKLRATKKAWRQANVVKLKSQGHARRLKIRGTPSFLPDDLTRIRISQKGKCALCRCSLKKSEHIDHILPIALGGTNEARNIQLTCGPCNWSKGAKHPVVFAQSRGLLL